MTVTYRVGPSEGDTVVEIEPHDNPPGAYITVTDDQHPSTAVLLSLDEITQLREVLGKVEEEALKEPAP